MLIFVLIAIAVIFLVKNINRPIYNLDNLLDYNGQPYVILNNDKLNFNESNYQSPSFEKYSELDFLGRVGIAYVNIRQDLMPTEERKSISKVYPTGCKQAKYDIVSGKYL